MRRDKETNACLFLLPFQISAMVRGCESTRDARKRERRYGVQNDMLIERENLKHLVRRKCRAMQQCWGEGRIDDKYIIIKNNRYKQKQ